jgi:hypothetical protein
VANSEVLQVGQDVFSRDGKLLGQITLVVSDRVHFEFEGENSVVYTSEILRYPDLAHHVPGAMLAFAYNEFKVQADLGLFKKRRKLKR